MNLASILELVHGNRAQAVAVLDPNGVQLSSLAGTPPTTAAITTPAASITSAVLVPANVDRRKVFIHNKSGKTLYIAFGPTATALAFTKLIAANTDWEADLNGYTGDISGIWAGTGGTAVITEVTV